MAPRHGGCLGGVSRTVPTRSGGALGYQRAGSERSERTLNPGRSPGEAVIMAQRGLQRVTAGTWYPCPMYRGEGGAVVIQAGVCVYIVIYVYCVY